MAEKIEKGAVVMTHGLHGATELNGCRGFVSNYDLQSERWAVHIDKVGHKKIKSARLIAAASGQAALMGKSHSLAPIATRLNAFASPSRVTIHC